MQFARHVHFLVKEGKNDEFRELFRRRVIPLLRNQPGFREEVTLVRDGRALGISLWDRRNDALQYHTTGYPRVLEALDAVIEGTPRVETFEVAATTLEQ